MKKSKILLIMALIVVTLTSVFSGCDFINNNQSQSSVDERYLYYAKFTIQHKIDAQLISEREVIVKRGDYPSIEVPWCKDGGYYFVDYQLYYTGNGEDEKIEDVTVRHNWIYADKPDVYTVEVDIDKMGWHCSFKVEVKDYRVKPTLVIDPAGAIEYTENERYVYKYDGNNHMPKALYCEYNGERIEFDYCSTTKETDWSYISSVTEIGIYEVWYEIEEYKTKIDDVVFRPIRLLITIEVIE